MKEALRELAVGPEGAGDRLDRFVAAQWPDLSRSRLAQLIDQGHLLIDGKVARPSARLKAGAQIALRIPDAEPVTLKAEAIDVPVLFEDSDLIVVNKPAGMVVHPAAGVHSGTLVNALLHSVRDLTGIGGELRPGIVHRLDKGTSGAMVVAKNEFALTRLQASFKSREVEKRYLAICHGVPKSPLTIDTPFGRHPVDRVRMTGRLNEEATTRRAVTHLTVSEAFGKDVALLDVTLETGRTHQIRVHLAEAGHPLLADEVYGGTKRDRKAADRVRAAAEALGRQALHSHMLAFPHPRTRATLRAEAPVPADFAKALELLRQYALGPQGESSTGTTAGT